ncbi:MAG: hypothetical protein U0269_28230 [Polyangiales bacterium]
MSLSRRALLLVLSLGGVRCGRRSYSVTDAASSLRPGWQLVRWDELRAARRAVAAVATVDRRQGQVWTRERPTDVAIPARSLVHIVTLVAASRAELTHVDDTFRCDGSRCERPHGLIRPADAMALGCRGYFDALAPRLGTSMLASAFAALAVTSPAVPEDPEARSRLASNGEGWSLTIDDALALASALRDHPGPEPTLWNEALVPRLGEPGPLRGIVAMDDREAWFVGYTVGTAERLVVAHVAECDDRAALVVLAAARAAFAGSVEQPRAVPAPPVRRSRR